MNDYIQPINLALSTLAFVLIAHWYLLPAIAHRRREEVLQPLLLLHSFRHIGLMFLAAGAVQTELPTAFSYPAAFGDLAAAILAFVALAFLRLRWKGAIAIVWLFSLEGTFDLLNAVYRGASLDAWDGMGTTFWIPSVIVPALLVTHYVIVRVLLQPTVETAIDDSRAGSQPIVGDDTAMPAISRPTRS